MQVKKNHMFAWKIILFEILAFAPIFGNVIDIAGLLIKQISCRAIFIIKFYDFDGCGTCPPQTVERIGAACNNR